MAFVYILESVITMTYSRVTEKDVAALTDIVTAERVIYPATVHYDHDQFKQVRSLPDMAVQPQTNEEVAAILRYANEHLIPVTVRGNATGLMGANVPIEHGIDIDMIKMNKVLDYDPDDLTLTVQNGFRIRDINEFLADKPFTYIPAPAMKWATIGGNASTNAGGMRAVKYGTTREHIRGITAVMVDGTIQHFGSKTVKNSSGYDLKDVIIGSEGTLAVITELILRLIPRPTINLDVLVPFVDVKKAISVVPKILRAGLVPTGLEFFSRETVEYWESYAHQPFMDHTGGGYLLITFDGHDGTVVQRDLDRAMQIARDNGALAPVLMGDEAHRVAVWETRNQLLTAIQQTTTAIDEVDIVVPISQIPKVLDKVAELQAKEKVSMPNFGHAGDGNLHIYMRKDDYSDEEFAAKVDRIIRQLYATAKALGGEMSGEHGIGFAREPYFEAYYGKDKVRILQLVKDAFDPNHILNPHKIFPSVGANKQENRPLTLD